jgi:hypothetical protein
MSWHDPARDHESEEDLDLRDELSQLLGIPTGGFFGKVEPTPKMIALAEDLRREALRRRHTARQRPLWMLMAAALPLALAVGALGSWGYQHKQRADANAAALAQKEDELQKLAREAVQKQFASAQAAPVSVVAMQSTVAPTSPIRVATHKPRPGELVIEVAPSASVLPPQTQTVKQTGP